MPFFLAIGIVYYFRIESNPGISFITFACVCTAILFVVSIKYRLAFLALFCLIPIGFLVAKIKTDLTKTNTVQREYYVKNIIGTIEDITEKTNYKKLKIFVAEQNSSAQNKNAQNNTKQNEEVNSYAIDNNYKASNRRSNQNNYQNGNQNNDQKNDQNSDRNKNGNRNSNQNNKNHIKEGIINLTVRQKIPDDIEIGDTIEFSALLKPPSFSLVPSGYNFAQFAYFNKIIATGFATSEIALVKKNDKKLSISKIRENIHKTLKANMQKDYANLAAALIIGKKDEIDTKIINNFRQSGTAHLLAISGLHFSLVSLIFFKLFRSLFTLSEYITLRFDIKKLSVIPVIMCGFLYLQIANHPVSTQRAFIMTAITLFAVVIDRRSNTMRSIAFAAIAIIIISPENIFNPGFQMSFFAVLGICAPSLRNKKFNQSKAHNIKNIEQSKYRIYYKLYIGRLYKMLNKAPIKKVSPIIGMLKSAIASSTFATMTTLPFCIYYFNYTSYVGIITNVIVIPIATFLIMPILVCILILMPIYNVASLYYALELFLKIIISINDFAQNFSGLYPHGFSGYTLFFIILGMLMLLFFKTKIKYFGIFVIAVGILSAKIHQTPDIFIAPNNIAAKGTDGKLYFLDFKQKPRNFVARAWSAHNGSTTDGTFRHSDANSPFEKINDHLYLYTKSNFKIAFNNAPDPINCNNDTNYNYTNNYNDVNKNATYNNYNYSNINNNAAKKTIYNNYKYNNSDKNITESINYNSSNSRYSYNNIDKNATYNDYDIIFNYKTNKKNICTNSFNKKDIEKNGAFFIWLNKKIKIQTAKISGNAF